MPEATPGHRYCCPHTWSLLPSHWWWDICLSWQHVTAKESCVHGCYRWNPSNSCFLYFHSCISNIFFYIFLWFSISLFFYFLRVTRSRALESGLDPLLFSSETVFSPHKFLQNSSKPSKFLKNHTIRTGPYLYFFYSSVSSFGHQVGSINWDLRRALFCPCPCLWLFF